MDGTNVSGRNQCFTEQVLQVQMKIPKERYIDRTGKDAIGEIANISMGTAAPHCFLW